MIWLPRIYILLRKLLAIGDLKTVWKEIQTVRVESIHKAMRDFNSIYIELKWNYSAAGFRDESP